MKTIFSSNEKLTEMFNKQSQHFGKANSLFFEGNILYSYGYHYPLAIIYSNHILINDLGYSVTTSKHIAIARNVTSNRKQILTSQIELNQVLQEFEYLHRKLLKARKPEKYTKAIKELKKTFDENVQYLGGFFVRSKSMFSGLNFEFVEFVLASNEQKQKLTRINSIWFNSLSYTI